MQTIAFASLILPGKTQLDRDNIESCAHGDRQAEHQASRKRAGTDGFPPPEQVLDFHG